MVQQLMSDGNIRNLFRNASPIGLIARTIWRFFLTRSVKKLYIAKGVASIFRPFKRQQFSEFSQLHIDIKSMTSFDISVDSIIVKTVVQQMILQFRIEDSTQTLQGPSTLDK
jgi:hypothetical protein